MAALAVACVTLAGGASPAAAEPVPDPAAVLTLPLQDVGGAKSLSFNVFRDAAQLNLTFTVPTGLAPTSLTATVDLPVDLRIGTLTATQNDRTLGRVDLPPRNQPRLTLPLNGVEVFGNWASITLTMLAVSREPFCWNWESPIRLSGFSVTFAGAAPAPVTVAEFLPPVMRRLSIAIPAEPTPAESTAAVQLAAAMALRYAALGPQIAVVRTEDPAPAPASPLERRVLLREGPDKGLTVLEGPGVPTLAVSGPGDELAQQTRLLSDPSLQFATGPRAVAGAVQSPARPPGDTVTLAKLKIPELTQTAVEPTVDLDVDQTRFGHPVSGVRVHLRGSHTPLPDNVGGELTVSADGRTVERWPVTETGDIDREITIPDDALKRTTTLRLAVDITGTTGECGQFQPMTLRVHPDTEIAVESAATPVPPGLQSLPQAFMPRLRVGLGDNGFADTARAATIVAGLQQASALPLSVTVTGLKEALDSRDPAVLIAADGWTDPEISLPFDVSQGSVTVEGYQIDGTPSSLMLDNTLAAGSLQTVLDGRRSLLIATSNGAPAQLDELLAWLAGERGRWSGVTGQAVISVPGAEPVTVPALPVADAARPASAGVRIGARWWIAGGAVVALALAGAITILIRTRQR